nr:MAG TPA: hypothetical protein [Caudoviricetes sp.]DAN63509.1 MAG TPA: hypothetical protein [Caudoviricetes sp.]
MSLISLSGSDNFITILINRLNNDLLPFISSVFFFSF